MEQMSENSGEEKQKKKKIVKILAVLSVILVLCGYIGGYLYFKDRFFVNTKLNGMDVSKKTVQEVLEIYRKKGDSYQLSIRENGAGLLEVSGTDIRMQYEIESLVRERFAGQNPYLWWEAYLKETEEKVSEQVSFDQEKMRELLSKEVFLPEAGRTAPESAAIVHDGENFVIQKEKAGTQIDAEKLEKLVFDRIRQMNPGEVELTNEDCYIQPDYTEQSPEVVQACRQMNDYCKAKVTYHFMGLYTEEIGKPQIAGWVTLGEGWQPGLNEEAVREHLNVLSAVYRGQMNVEMELPLVLSAIQNCEVTDRTPEPDLNTLGGKTGAGTYIEVDLTAQHMWYVENGKTMFECDVVTGRPGRNTPAGNYRITEKLRNKILTGNIVPETGEPEYRTKVSYWMRITNSGIGFHDATWQPVFGGERYKRYGSHGCINMPYSAIQELYGMTAVGTRVVIHH